ncbi:hypothetical protein B0A52_02954 [Exophiala mesophila]|uniref:Uncharacterized protein n=1 Tax=Exophiala mesophila TaxID=212818 RepID=A0A438NC11_EXOME|nr:hypothetical protein B0A52_02954 [Exophiala mesophila]
MTLHKLKFQVVGHIISCRFPPDHDRRHNFWKEYRRIRGMIQAINNNNNNNNNNHHTQSINRQTSQPTNQPNQ